MKIAVIVPARSEALFDKDSKEVFGGGNVQMYQIAKELGRCDGVDSYTFIEDFETINFEESGQFKLVKTYKKSDNFLVKFWKYHRKLRLVKPDAVLQHGLTFFSSLLAVYCKLFRIKFVYMFAHDNEAKGCYQENSKESFVFNWLLNFSSVLITQNDYQKQQLLSAYGKESCILRNGFYLKPEQKPQGDYVLWVARHSLWKRPELYMQLASQNPHLQFKMVCPTSLAPGYEDLQRKAEQVKNLEFVKFVPFDEIDAIFENAKLFVNTSDYEGFPQTFIQATMNSLPVLSLNVNPDQILTDYGFGSFCDGDFDELNDKLQLLFADANLYKEMSHNAFLYADRNHDIRKNVKSLVALITSVQ